MTREEATEYVLKTPMLHDGCHVYAKASEVDIILDAARTHSTWDRREFPARRVTLYGLHVRGVRIKTAKKRRRAFSQVGPGLGEVGGRVWGLASVERGGVYHFVFG